MRPLSLSKEEFSECYLDLRKSMLLVDDFISQYNQDKPLRKQLRASHRSLMHELLSIYRIVLWKEQSGGALLIPDTPLPYFSTNNVQLAKKITCSGRTIQNLRQRLLEGELIMDEIWHGSKANYELRLNPEVIFLSRRGDRRNWISLFEDEQPKTPAPERRRLNANRLWKTTVDPVEITSKWPFEGNPDLPPYEEKNAVFEENFSPKCTLSLQDTNQLNQLEIGQCGNRAGTDVNQAGNQRRISLIGYETDSDEHLKPPRVARRPPGEEEVTGRCGDVVKPPLSDELFVALPQASPNPHRGKNFATTVGGMDEQALPKTFGEVVAELPDKLGRRIFREVSKVWAVAREELYAGEWIADAERERAKARLAEYYVNAKPERYAAGTTEICERIRLVRKWIDRGLQAGQERWVPIPSIYFDYRNGRGFSKTKAWFKKHRAKRQEIGDNIAVARAVRRYERCRAGTDRSKGPMQMYQEVVTQLRERGEAAVERFCEVID